MIVCSCNVLSDHDVRSAVKAERTRSTSQVYRCLGCRAKCGSCARTIRRLMDEDSTAPTLCPVTATWPAILNRPPSADLPGRTYWPAQSTGHHAFWRSVRQGSLPTYEMGHRALVCRPPFQLTTSSCREGSRLASDGCDRSRIARLPDRRPRHYGTGIEVQTAAPW